MRDLPKIIALLFLLWIPARSNAGLSDSAATYYARSEFQKAIRCYESILEEGKDSWILYYNLGNAYFKNNNLGKAILNYEKAKKLNPTNNDLLNNMQIAESKVIDKIEHRQILLQSEIKNFFIYRLSTTGWAWMTIGTLLTALFLFFMFYAANSTGIKRFSFWTGSVFSILFLLSLTFGFMALNEKNSKVNGVIVAPAVNVYNSPRAEDNNKKTYQLNEGTKVKLLEIEQEWANVQLANGNEGWIKAAEVGVY